MGTGQASGVLVHCSSSQLPSLGPTSIRLPFPGGRSRGRHHVQHEVIHFLRWLLSKGLAVSVNWPEGRLGPGLQERTMGFLIMRPGRPWRARLVCQKAFGRPHQAGAGLAALMSHGLVLVFASHHITYASICWAPYGAALHDIHMTAARLQCPGDVLSSTLHSLCEGFPDQRLV